MAHVRENSEEKTVKDFVLELSMEHFDKLCEREREVAEKLDELTANPFGCMLRMMANDSSDLKPLRTELQAIYEYKQFLLTRVNGLDTALVIREAESVGA